MKKIGLQITEDEYRSIKLPSYSLLSGLAKSGPAALYSEKEDISDLDGIIIGSLVDSIITDGGLPDNLVVVDKKPSGKALKIIKALAERDDLIDKDYVLSPKNNGIIEQELDKEEYYKSSSFGTRVTKLRRYKKYASTFTNSSFVASTYQVDTAKALVNKIRLRFPFVDDDNIIFQVKLTGWVCTPPIEVKGMLDFIRIDHENKKIIPYDLKTGIGNHYDFFERGFLGFNYYLQASLYRVMLENTIRENHPEYDEYEIDNFRFMFCGRGDFLPIVYVVDDHWHKAGWEGFKYEGITFPGLYKLLDDYKFYLEHPNAFYRRGFDKDEVLFPSPTTLKQTTTNKHVEKGETEEQQV